MRVTRVHASRQVVVHDDLVTRTAELGWRPRGPGGAAVAELTLAELQAVPLAGGGRVPTLEAPLAAGGDSICTRPPCIF